MRTRLSLQMRIKTVKYNLTAVANLDIITPGHEQTDTKELEKSRSHTLFVIFWTIRNFGAKLKNLI